MLPAVGSPAAPPAWVGEGNAVTRGLVEFTELGTGSQPETFLLAGFTRCFFLKNQNKTNQITAEKGHLEESTFLKCTGLHGDTGEKAAHDRRDAFTFTTWSVLHP